MAPSRRSPRISFLTPKQLRFVQEYLVDLNAAQAYIRAGYAARGHVAEANASRLLRNAEVAQRVREAEEARASQVGMTAADVLRELQLLGRSTIDDYVVSDGWIDVREGRGREVLRAVSAFKIKTRRFFDKMEGAPVEETEVEIRLWDKPGSLNLAGKHLGMFAGIDLQIDLSQCDAGQLQRIAAGEDPRKVLALDKAPRP